jgi:hypothetical protein
MIDADSAGGAPGVRIKEWRVSAVAGDQGAIFASPSDGDRVYLERESPCVCVCSCWRPSSPP